MNMRCQLSPYFFHPLNFESKQPLQHVSTNFPGIQSLYHEIDVQIPNIKLQLPQQIKRITKHKPRLKKKQISIEELMMEQNHIIQQRRNQKQSLSKRIELHQKNNANHETAVDREKPEIEYQELADEVVQIHIQSEYEHFEKKNEEQNKIKIDNIGIDEDQYGEHDVYTSEYEESKRDVAEDLQQQTQRVTQNQQNEDQFDKQQNDKLLKQTQQLQSQLEHQIEKIVDYQNQNGQNQIKFQKQILQTISQPHQQQKDKEKLNQIQNIICDNNEQEQIAQLMNQIITKAVFDSQIDQMSPINPRKVLKMPFRVALKQPKPIQPIVENSDVMQIRQLLHLPPEQAFTRKKSSMQTQQNKEITSTKKSFSKLFVKKINKPEIKSPEKNEIEGKKTDLLKNFFRSLQD